MKTLAEVISAFPQEIVEKYDFSCTEYHGALVRMGPVICERHGAFTQYPAQFRKRRGCPKCGHDRRGKNRRTNPVEFFDQVRKFHGGKYSYDETTFKTMQSRIKVTCPDHGEFSMNAAKHYYARQGCGLCEAEAKPARIVKYRHLSSAAKIKNTGEHFFDDCRETHDGKYEYPEAVYRGAKKKIRVICKEHGEFRQAAFEHLNGTGCPKCGAYDPKWETEIAEYIEHHGFSVRRNARILDGQEIDLYIESLDVGIELHGLWWHTERTRKKNYHRDKWELAQKKGIRLIQIFEDEWKDKKSIVLSRVDAILGQSETFMARKCDLVRMDSLEARDFLESHHIDGFVNAKLHYGLVFDGRVIAVASFGKRSIGRKSQWNEWEHVRYASRGRVNGGFSKILKRFLEDSGAECLVSYCDLRYGDGSLYKACGFELVGITDPDYWWIKPGRVKRISRYRTQKKKIPNFQELRDFYDPNLSEAQICHSAGWERIYGVGHQRWILNTK